MPNERFARQVLLATPTVEVNQESGVVVTSRTLPGPVLVWSQQKLSEIAENRDVFRFLLGLLPRDYP